MDCVGVAPIYLSHTKTLLLAGTVPWAKGHSTLHYSRAIEGKIPTLFFAGATIANYFQNFSYAVSDYRGWAMVIRKPTILVCFCLCMVTKWPRLSVTTSYDSKASKGSMLKIIDEKVMIGDEGFTQGVKWLKWRHKVYIKGRWRSWLIVLSW